MSDSQPRKRKTPKNSYTTSSGKTIKINRSLTERMKAGREAKAQRKAAYLSSLPKERWRRVLYRLHPKRMAQYWFSRDGGIMALKILGIGFVCGFLLIVGLFAYFRKDLPKIQDINGGDSGGSIAYYDRTGKVMLFQDYDAFKRIPVSSDQISQNMKDATIAVEDKDFYHEGAFNIKGIIRAAVNDLRGGSTQGGSTITQQLVKLNEGWTNDHTISRKVKELILAVELEREYSKDDILTAYLNMAPYSGTDYGVQAAAKDYFHVDAKDLTLPQAAMLASIPKSPTEYSPYSSPNWNSQASGYYFNENGLLARQQYVIGLMQQQGYINAQQKTDAKNTDIIAQVQQMPTDHYAGIQDPYFVLAAKKELSQDFPAAVLKTGGWKVTTTMDANLQDLAQKSLNDNIRKLHGDKADDASFVAEDNTTGQVMALIGGVDFNTQQVNFASDAPISPGSSIKPYSYAALINDNNNVGAGSMLADKQQSLPGYPCTNKGTPEHDPGSNCLWDDTRTYYGNVTLRYALGSSLNVPAVKAFTSTDPKDNSTVTNSDGTFNTAWRAASINNTMKTVNAFMGNSDAYKCYDPVKLQEEGKTILTANQADEVHCGAAAGIGNEAYTTLLDHTNGIASIARMGQSIPPTFILKVTNASGKTLKEFKQPKPTQVVRTDAAWIVTNMAADPGASYLSGSCTTTTCYGMKFHRYKGWQNAIKTGTNQDLDGLMMSWNTKYTAGIWIGNYNRDPYGGSPENVTDPIMKEFMEGAIDSLGNVKPNNWPMPSDIKTLAAFHSAVPFRSESSPPSTDYFPSWYVGKSSGKSGTIDRVSGLTATACTPDLAKQNAGATNSSPLNVDIYIGGAPNIGSSGSSTTGNNGGSDNVHACSDDPPTVTITAINGTPTGGNSPTCPSTGCTVMVHVEQGTHPFNDPQYPTYPGTLNVIVNGQTVQSQPVNSSGDYSFTYTPPTGTTGGMQLTVQVTDSVLYTGSDTESITIPDTSPVVQPPTTGGGTGGGGNNNNHH